MRGSQSAYTLWRNPWKSDTIVKGVLIRGVDDFDRHKLGGAPFKGTPEY